MLNFALSGAQVAQDAASSQGAFSARVSVDGGQTFAGVNAPDLSLAGVDGTTSEQTLTARGLTLSASTSPTDGRNVIEFSAQDMSGRAATARRTFLVNLNAATPPVLLAPSLSVASASVSLAIPDGNTYWRVSAHDRFGTQSPYTAERRVSLDTQPPAFGPPEAAAAGSEAYVPADRPQNTTTIDVRATVRDTSSGLAVTATSGGPAALAVIPGTLGLWHFDEGVGTVTADASGVAGAGTLNGGVAWVDGKIGKAVRVSDTGALSQGVTLAPSAHTVINNMSAGTIELWGKLIQGSLNANHHTFTTKQHNGSDTMFYFGWEGTAMSLRW
ncbi:MAG: hypothetical protein FD126_3701, partial [Elusimicrobia bacterium]